LFGGLLPSHYVRKRPGGWNTGLDKDPQKIPSAGPFKVESWEQGLSLTLVRNDKYWGTKAHLDSIVFRFLPESTNPATALQNDEVDLIYPQPQLDQVAQAKALRGVHSELNLGLLFEQFQFNFKNPFLADVAVRKAIATGLSTQELVNRTIKQFSDKVQPLGNRIWMNDQPQYQDHMGQYGKGDIAGARKLLEGAGYTKGADGIYTKGGKRLSVRFSTTAGNAAREVQSELFQAQMQDVGIDINITNTDEVRLFRTWLPQGNFDIANFAWAGTPYAISGSRDIYRTGGGGNYGQYSNKRIDDLFRRAVAETDETKAIELSNQIDQILTDDMATIPLYQKPTFLAYRNSFVNIRDNVSAEGLFFASATWGQKA
jgi:peptide/nickel transport system substrate-binding protein